MLAATTCSHLLLPLLQVACGWRAEMRARIAQHIVELLVDVTQMPTEILVEVPDVLFGADAKVVDHVVELLTAGGESHMMLLHGMGGIGKTTVAKAVFSKLQTCHPCRVALLSWTLTPPRSPDFAKAGSDAGITCLCKEHQLEHDRAGAVKAQRALDGQAGVAGGG
jgi:hypothetical protein